MLIRLRRMELGALQAAAAEGLRRLGVAVSQPTLSRWEAGVTPVAPEGLKGLAVWLGTSEDAAAGILAAEAMLRAADGERLRAYLLPWWRAQREELQSGRAGRPVIDALAVGAARAALVIAGLTGRGGPGPWGPRRSSSLPVAEAVGRLPEALAGLPLDRWPPPPSDSRWAARFDDAVRWATAGLPKRDALLELGESFDRLIYFVHIADLADAVLASGRGVLVRWDGGQPVLVLDPDEGSGAGP